MKETTSKNTNTSKSNAGKAANQNATKQNAGSAKTPENGEGSNLLKKFFLDQLKDIYYAEQKIVKSLPDMIEASTTEELKEAFEDHLHQTQRQVKRLEKVFSIMNESAEGKKCEAIEGITKEASSIIAETKADSMTRDAALIIAAQKVEHYEIATYGGLVQLAITMGMHEEADLLEKTLQEEEDTDMLLTEIAENYINLEAEKESGNSSKEKTAANSKPAATVDAS